MMDKAANQQQLAVPPRPSASPTQNQPLLEVRHLQKFFPIRNKGLTSRIVGHVRAVDDVNFSLLPGQTLGLVGESGCGKTTTGRAILRAIDPTAGSIMFRPDGQPPVDLAALSHAQLKPLRTKMQMIFQDPFSSLNPRMTIGDIVAEPLIIHRLARGSERADLVAAMLRKVGLNPEHANRYPHAFSGGQRQRVGIARALIMNPSLVIADEAVSALDVSVQAQIINLLQDLQQELNLTLLFIAHDLSVVRHLCDQVAVMYAGRIVEVADTQTLFASPHHPYTKALLSAVPDADPDVPMNFDLAGEVADPANLPSGCAFHPRCPAASPDCRSNVPELDEVSPGHQSSCHRC